MELQNIWLLSLSKMFLCPICVAADVSISFLFTAE